MIDLKGKMLLHSAFGEGEVISQDGDYIVIKFNEGEKKISAIYAVKNKLIKFKDPVVMKEVEEFFDGILDSASLRKELKKTKEE